MLKFVFHRLVGAVLTLAAASVLIFVVLEVLPGDPALVMLGEGARPDTLAALRTEMGLDQPAVVRFFAWIGGLFAGDLGLSHTYGTPVLDMLAERCLVTLPLAGFALLLALPVGVGLGTLAAALRGRLPDHLLMVLGHLGLALPSFWIGILLIMTFPVSLNLGSAGGFPGWQAGAGLALAALVLPALALAVPEAAILARVTRGAVLETLGADFVRVARAKGLSRGRVIRRHVIGHAALPVVTIAGLQFGVLMAGAILVERVFAIAGLGDLLFNAAGDRDLPVIKGTVLLICGVVIAANLLVDVIHASLDPRPRSAAS
ncbi:MAG: ABC transporter permease [Rhodospirillaceae bacterium]|nr:ABC transporter permease [Rhodospirillaceae bacterium]